MFVTVEVCGKVVLILATTVALLSVNLPFIRHEVKLRSNAASNGAIVEARINGHRLRLLLDTGAGDIVLSTKTAERCGLKAQRQVSLSGITGIEIEAGRTTASVEFDGFQLDAVAVRMLHSVPVQQADGLLGTRIFSDYLVEIDAPQSRLRLLSRGGDTGGTIPLREIGHMLFVQLETGYALVDTGSSFSLLDRPNGGAGSRETQWIPVRTASGHSALAQKLTIPARFDLGSGSILWDRQPVAMDLSALSRRHGIEVKAVIGYPALRRRAMQLDYQQRTLRIID